MGFLDEKCRFKILSREAISSCSNFSCSLDKDIDDFFHGEFELYNQQLFGKSYGFFTETEPSDLVAAFTVSNSMLPVKDYPTPIRRKINKEVPFPKRSSQHPAVLIGQLVVFDKFKHLHIGNELVDFIKSWFIHPLNKTGCRYLIVDAVNHPKVLDFYTQNGFNFIFPSIEDEISYMNLDLEPEYKRTRLMYFDLIILKS